MIDVLVTGIGICTAIGSDSNENRNALLNAKSGISKSKLLTSNFVESRLFGEVKQSNDQLSEELGFTNGTHTRTSLLAFKAIKEAINSAKLDPKTLNSGRTAFISATTVGGMSQTEQLFEDANTEEGISPYINSYNFGSHTKEIANFYKIKGISNTINTACTSSLNSIAYGANLIKSGKADIAIVGGTDALCKFTINGFNSMGILSMEHCKPFSEDRTGLNLGEGAAYLILERKDKIENKDAFAKITSYGNSNDAFHQSSLSDEALGIIASIEECLTKAGLSPNDIDYINAHGTATENNDFAEQVAYNKVFGEGTSFSSTKGFTGHTLGACGAIEAIFSIFSLQENKVFKNYGYSKKMKEFGTIPILENESKPINHVLTNSYGFNGNCSSLILSKA